jgi:hypothetical protein
MSTGRRARGERVKWIHGTATYESNHEGRPIDMARARRGDEFVASVSRGRFGPARWVTHVRGVPGQMFWRRYQAKRWVERELARVECLARNAEREAALRRLSISFREGFVGALNRQSAALEWIMPPGGVAAGAMRARWKR